jgi:hypothetical protein
LLRPRTATTEKTSAFSIRRSKKIIMLRVRTNVIVTRFARAAALAFDCRHSDSRA